MPYHMGWLVEGQVLFVVVQGKLLTEEQNPFFKSVAELAASVPDTVHIIADLRSQIERLSIGAATQVAIHYPMPRTIGWVLPINEKTQGNIFLHGLFAQFFGVKLHPVESVAEAIAFLKQQDPRIDWEHADYSVAVDPPEALDAEETTESD